MRVRSFGKRHLPLAGGSCSFPDTCTLPLSMASSGAATKSVPVFYGSIVYLHTSLHYCTICVTLV
jgi:hypothetical protein